MRLSWFASCVALCLCLQQAKCVLKRSIHGSPSSKPDRSDSFDSVVASSYSPDPSHGYYDDENDTDHRPRPSGNDGNVPDPMKVGQTGSDGNLGAPQVNPFFKQASTASISVLFGLLSWRSLSAYEMAEGFRSSFIRFICSNICIGLVFLNLGALLINAFKPLNFKDQLKSCLILNIAREWVELLFNAFKILIASLNSRSLIQREVYFGRLFMNVWWTLLTGAFVKSRWVKGATAAQFAYQDQQAQQFAQQQEFRRQQQLQFEDLVRQRKQQQQKY
jgi:hypothetical protein